MIKKEQWNYILNLIREIITLFAFILCMVYTFSNKLYFAFIIFLTGFALYCKKIIKIEIV